jgi:hypothetical protein
MSDPTVGWSLLYTVALTGAPGHSGFVAGMPDGRLGILEAGFNDSAWTRFTPLDYRLHQYRGSLWVRRKHVPLDPWQDARLTEFAVQADNTRYNVHEFTRLITPFRERGPIRTFVVGRPRGPGYRLVCSEAILEALAYAGVLDPKTIRPTATFPRDLFFDRSPNLFIHLHPPLAAGWEAPALWTPTPGVAEPGKARAPVDGVVVMPPQIPASTRRFRR